MRWIDVFGPPGVGKSALCDDLWDPHAINWQDPDLKYASDWQEFMRITVNYLNYLGEHPTYKELLGMTNRSYRKMAKVDSIDSEAVYIQTGFAQRGLGFGWRLENPEMVRAFYEEMPVSLGAISLQAPADVLKARNKAREGVPETAHENRAHMIDPMLPAQQIAIEVLSKRTPLFQVDTTRPIEDVRREIKEFCDSLAGVAENREGKPAQVVQRQPSGSAYQKACGESFCAER